MAHWQLPPDATVYKVWIADRVALTEASRHLPELYYTLSKLMSVWGCVNEHKIDEPFHWVPWDQHQVEVTIYWWRPRNHMGDWLFLSDDGGVDLTRVNSSRHDLARLVGFRTRQRMRAREFTLHGIDWSATHQPIGALVDILRGFKLLTELDLLGFQNCTFASKDLRDLEASFSGPKVIKKLSLVDCLFSIGNAGFLTLPQPSTAWARLTELTLVVRYTSREPDERPEHQHMVLTALSQLPGTRLERLTYSPKDDTEIFTLYLGNTLRRFAHLQYAEIWIRPYIIETAQINFPQGAAPRFPNNSIRSLTIRYRVPAARGVTELTQLALTEHQMLRAADAAIAYDPNRQPSIGIVACS